MALALVAAACGDDSDNGNGNGNGEPEAQETGGTLQRVLDNEELVCGVNDGVPGFGIVDADGAYSGFDIDFCRAVAAAVLGDADAVEFVALTADERFTALQSGRVDVLIRNTTWTAARDGTENATFLPTTFYDGQGMMVHADSGIDSIDDMEGTTVCVLTGTTTELNLTTRFEAGGMAYEPFPAEESDELQAAFMAGQCDGWTSDASQLAAFKAEWPEEQGGPDSVVVLDEIFSKEPLGPAVLDGDTAWADAVQWAVLATIQAEEFGIDQGTLEAALAGEDDFDHPDVQRFLGQESDEDTGEAFDPGLNLAPDFAVNVIEQVGNYGEIFERNVTPLDIDRAEFGDGINLLWTEGGLLYAPPYR
jgi:general L-amino acid transport system substrate-binding protein